MFQNKVHEVPSLVQYNCIALPSRELNTAPATVLALLVF